MNIVLKKVKFKNFMRIRDMEIDIPPEGVIGILAQGIDDPESSNYIGKSTILEGIKYNFTGDSRASTDVKLIHYGEDHMMTETTSIDLDSGEEFVIKRGRDSKGNGLVEYSDSKKIGEKSAEAEKCIQEMLGMTPDDFDLTIFFKQAEINQFMDLDPAAKKKMLMKWQNNEHWTQKESDVLKDIKEKKDSIKALRVQLDNLNTDVGSMDELQAEHTGTEILVSNLTGGLKRLEDRFEEASSSGSITQAEFDRISREQEELKVKNVKMKQQLGAFKQYEAELEELKKEPVSMGAEDVTTLETGAYKFSQLTKDLAAKKLKFQTSVKSNTGICPIISEECDRIKLTPTRKKEMEDEIQSIQDEITALDDTCHRLKLLKKDADDYSTSLDRLTKQLADKPLVLEKMSSLKSSFLKNKEMIAKYDPEAAQTINKLKQDIATERSLLSQAQSKLGALSEKIRVVEQNQSKADDIRTKLQGISEELDNLLYVAYMFGKNGIPSLEIENSFQNIEEEINYSLSEIDDFEVIFRPDRELKAWEENCLSCGFKFPKNYKKTTCTECEEPRRKKRKDELALSVIDRGNESDFDMCSGGLKTLISLAVRTALTMLRKRQNKSNLNILFLDEIDSPLDRKNKDKILAFISNTLHIKYGFKQIFWISHDKTISHNVPQTLLVKGYKDYSKVDWL